MRILAFCLMLCFAVIGRSAADTLPDYPPTLGTMSGFVLFEERVPLPPHMPLADKQGQGYRLTDFKGQVLVVNFWAEWCAPCKRELPSLAKLQDQYDPDKMRVVLMDVNHRGRKDGDAYLKRDKHLHNLLNLYEGGGPLAKAMKLRALPITFLIDKQARMVGYFPGEAHWHGRDSGFLIDAVLNEQ